MYTTSATAWSTWIAQCLQLRPTTSSSTTPVSMVMRITIRGRIFHKGGGGDDAEHPTFIPMYTPTTPQAPRGHMTRPRIYTIGHKVNSLLFKPSLSTCETWLLPHAWILHILRYDRDDHGESKDQGQAWKRRRKRTWPLQNERYNRSTTARAVQPADYRPTTGHLSVVEQCKAGTAPDVPVITK